MPRWCCLTHRETVSQHLHLHANPPFQSSIPSGFPPPIQPATQETSHPPTDLPMPLALEAGCLFFDHCYPAERGYGYVGASRFRSKDGIFYYGTVRRSDWLPRYVDEEQQVQRSYDSQSEDSEDAEREAEYDSSEEEDSMDGDLGRLCRSGDTGGDAMADSGSEDDSCELRDMAMAAGGVARALEEADGASALGHLLG